MWTLLTGGTGFVGQQVLRDLLKAGERVVLLVRGKTSVEAATKWGKIQQTLPIEQLPNVIWAYGDLFELDSCKRLAYMEGIKRIVHCAGDVSFSKNNNCHTTNVVGLSNLLQLARDYSIEEFHHVSTAYVCGSTNSTVYELRNGPTEDLPCISFKNDYEKSKFEAEEMLFRNQVACPWMHVTIYRPTVVVGSELSGATTCFNGFYQVIKAAWNVSRGFKTGLVRENTIRLPFSDDSHINLVPVDHVSRVICWVIANPQFQRKIYHVTPSQPMSALKVTQAILGYFKDKGYNLPEVVATPELARHEMSTLERMLEVWLGPYAPYFATDPVFDTTSTDTALGAKYLLNEEVFIPRIVDYAISTNFGRKKPCTD